MSSRTLALELVTLYDLTGMIQNTMEVAAEQYGASITPEDRAEMFRIVDRIDVNALTDSMIDVLGDVFSDEELEALVAFWSSQVGARVMKKLPAFTGQFRPHIERALNLADGE